MHQPATAELIRKTDEQTDALHRQKKLLQAMACFHRLHSAAHSRALARRFRWTRVCESIPLHWLGAPGTESGYRALSAAIGCATGAVANVTQATYVHS